MMHEKASIKTLILHEKADIKVPNLHEKASIKNADYKIDCE